MAGLLALGGESVGGEAIIAKNIESIGGVRREGFLVEMYVCLLCLPSLPPLDSFLAAQKEIQRPALWFLVERFLTYVPAITSPTVIFIVLSPAGEPY